MGTDKNGWTACRNRLREIVRGAPRHLTHAVVTKATWWHGDRVGSCGAVELFSGAPDKLAMEAEYPSAQFRRWPILGPKLADQVIGYLRSVSPEPLHPHWERPTRRYMTPRPAWPRYELRFGVDGQDLDSNTGEPLLAMGQRPHASLRAALAAWFPRRDPFPGHWSVLIPDERARISHAEFHGDGRIEIDVEVSKALGPLEVHSVLASPYREGLRELSAVVVAGRASLTAQIEASRGDLFLLGPGDEVLDALAVERAPREPVNIGSQELSARCVMDLRNGEDEHVEIKPWISASDTKETELLVTMIAFANTDGGRLYVGADDDGVPLGRGELLRRFGKHGDDAEQAAAQRIEKIALEKLVRPPPFKVHRLDIDGAPLLCVEVEPGPDRPYATKHNDIYVRRRASNRRPEAHLVSLGPPQGQLNIVDRVR